MFTVRYLRGESRDHKCIPVDSKRLVLVAALLVTACGGGKGGSTSPSAVTAPTIPSTATATLITQSGCAATYMCPKVDTNGATNPSTATFNTLTVSNGTSQSCRADIYRNSQSPELSADFTIRNANATGYFWASDASTISFLPRSGNATAGPIHVTVENWGGGGNIRSGDTVAQSLTLSLRQATSGNPLVAQCAVTLWGYIVPGK